MRNALHYEWKSARVIRLSKAENVYTSGQRDDKIYLVEEGQVEIVVYPSNGKRCILSVQVEGEVFGELGVMVGARPETATARGHTVLRAISASRLRSTLDEAGIAKEFALHLLARLSHQEQTIANMVMLNSEQRLAVVLLELARKVGRRHGEELRIEQRITHEDLAAMVGTTRSRIGLFLKAFHARGLLILNGTPYLSVNERSIERYVSAFAVTPVPFPPCRPPAVRGQPASPRRTIVGGHLVESHGSPETLITAGRLRALSMRDDTFLRRYFYQEYPAKVKDSKRP